VQSVSQSADSAQQATSASGATQIAPSNSNIDVRVLSPGNDGAVTQSNTASSDASSSNSNSTTQGASQDQTGNGIQTSNQSAVNGQAAAALSGASQAGASNSNLPVNVLSPGNGGAVNQSNGVASSANSTNTNTTAEGVDQTQSGGSSCGCSPPVTPEAAAPSSAPTTQGQTGGGSSPAVQSATQSAENGQVAGSASSATQIAPSNQNIAVRVLSPGNDGPVTQSNTDTSNASASNTNSTNQAVDQDPTGSSSCGCGSPGSIQTAQQSAGNLQIAGADSTAVQKGAQNVNTPVRVLSPGNDGPVSQSNSVSSTASAKNTNDTKQAADQSISGSGGCGCASSDPIQTVDQSSGSLQGAGALSAAGQIDPSNNNSPVRVGSSGDGGSVTQSNTDSSNASASNSNSTTQAADQDASSAQSPCGCGGGVGIQAIGQKADNGQVALAASGALQTFGGKSECGCGGSSGGGNVSDPIRVWSPGNDGSVTQSNTVDSTADSSNSNSTIQAADQDASSAHSPCGCGGGVNIQAIGQKADNGQVAQAASGALQTFGGKSECGCGGSSGGGNVADPIRVWSPGNDGSVTQSNTADSTADSSNSNSTTQAAAQSQSGGGGIGIQALGQEADNGQFAGALSGAFQIDPSNHADGVRVYSPGNGGSVDQSNDASSEANAKNTNHTTQAAAQSQDGSGSCTCGGGLDIQALGQSAANLQAGFGFSTAFSLAPSNTSGGAAVWSPGNGSTTKQENEASSIGDVDNLDAALQLASQKQ
jgi:hypothetical protein